MIMGIPGVGSQYLMGFLDASKNDLRGGRTYKVTLPKGIPAAAFWSFTLYDNQTPSMLETPRRFPRAGSQSYPSPAAEPNADGSTTVYFGPTQPAGAKRGNWIQRVPGKGWFGLLRPYSPLESFFTKEWRLSAIELVPRGSADLPSSSALEFGCGNLAETHSCSHGGTFGTKRRFTELSALSPGAANRQRPIRATARPPV